MNKSMSIIGLLVWFLCYGSGLQAAWSADFTPTIEAVRQASQEILQDEGVVGFSVAIVSDDEIVWQEGFGYANREENIPATPDTVYAIGSVSKMFTAVSVLQQVEQGRIDLDRPVSDYLPEFSILHRFGASQKEQNDMITMRRLLTHRSGVPGDIHTGIFLTGPSYYSTYMSWMLDYLATTYPSQEPGVIASYSNTGFILAGEAARRAGALAGEEEMGEFFHRTIFESLGMTNTYTHVFGEDIPALAMGYAGGQPVPPFEFNGVATGGVFSSVSDMATFMLMLMNEGTEPNSGAQLLSPESVREMGRMDPGPYDFGTFLNPGLGLDCAHLYPFIEAIPPLEVNGHSYGRAWVKTGGTSNFISILSVLPSEKLGVVLLFNSDSGSQYTFDLMHSILHNALRDKLAMEVPAPTLPDYSDVAITDPSLVTGLYVCGNQPMEVTEVENGVLNLTLYPGLEEENIMVITPVADIHYAIEGDPGYFTFVSVNDQTLLLHSGGPAGTFEGTIVTLYAEKIEPAEIPSTWRDRLGAYVYDTMPPDDVLWLLVDPLLEQLTLQKDAYLIFEAFTLPQSDTLAMVLGMANRRGSYVSMDDDGGIDYAGYHFIPVESIPSVSVGGVVSFDVHYSSVIPKTQWYWFEVSSELANQRILWNLNDDTITLRLYGSELNWLAKEEGQLSAVLEPGRYYLAVSPGFESPSTGTLQSTIHPVASNAGSWEVYR
jgi:CubicO group peptidase (beta-lactamase class C family)